MFSLFVVSLLLAAVQAVPTKSLCFSQTVTLTPQKPTFSFPLRQLFPSQNCTLVFEVPLNYFAIATIYSDQMNQDRHQDNIVVFGTNQYLNVAPEDGDTSFYSNLAWPATTFQIHVHTGSMTFMQYNISVVLQKNLFGQNIVQTITTSDDGPSSLLYIEDLKEGHTYNIVSRNSSVVPIWGLANPEQTDFFNNIFVYGNGSLAGTLLANDWIYSGFSTIQLYVANSVSSITDAAILLTDYSNVIEDFTYYVAYVPVANQYRNDTLYIGTRGLKGGCVTIIGPKIGATYTITEAGSLTSFASGEYVYAGGPLDDPDDSIGLDSSTLPLRLGGNLNTVCIGIGEGYFKYQLS